jgi:hypothetical protein
MDYFTRTEWKQRVQLFRIEGNRSQDSIRRQDGYYEKFAAGVEIVENAARRLAAALEGMLQFEDDLQQYVKDLKETVKVLINS